MRDPAENADRKQLLLGLLELAGLPKDLLDQVVSWWYDVAPDCHLATLLIERRIISLANAQVLFEVETGKLLPEQAPALIDANGRRRLEAELASHDQGARSSRTKIPIPGEVDRETLTDPQAYWDSFGKGTFIAFDPMLPGGASGSSQPESTPDFPEREPPSPGEFRSS